MQEEIMRKALKLLRDQRHDFANHLQILSGYHQLHKEEAAHEYLKMMIAQLHGDAILSKMLTPKDYLWFKEEIASMESAGAKLKFRIVQVSEKLPAGEELDFREAWRSFQEKLDLAEGQNYQLLLTINQTANDVYLTFGMAGDKKSCNEGRTYLKEGNSGNIELTIRMR